MSRRHLETFGCNFSAVVSRLRGAETPRTGQHGAQWQQRFREDLARLGFVLDASGEIMGPTASRCGEYRWREVAEAVNGGVSQAAPEAAAWVGEPDGIIEWWCFADEEAFGRAVWNSTFGPIRRTRDDALAPPRCAEIAFELAFVNRRHALDGRLLSNQPEYLAYVNERLERTLLQAGFEGHIAISEPDRESVIAFDVARRSAKTWWQRFEHCLRRGRAGVELYGALQSNWERRALRGTYARFVGQASPSETSISLFFSGV